MINNVVFGFLGSRLDQGGPGDRWQTWRPTVALGMHEEFLMRRFEIFHGPNETQLLQTVVEDLGSVSPETEIRTHAMPLSDPWDFEEVYGKLHDFFKHYPFHPEAEEYFANITTGTHTEQICCSCLPNHDIFPASSSKHRRLAASP